MKCPNKNLPEWQALEASQPDLAYYYWDKYDGKIPSSLLEKEELSNKMIGFLEELNVSVEFKEELRSDSGFDASSLTDLIYKTIKVRNDYKEDGLLKETAYVAYSMLGKKNKIRTDLINSIDIQVSADKLRNG